MEIAIPHVSSPGLLPQRSRPLPTIFKALISVKARNALVLSPHHDTMRCMKETVRVLQEGAAKEGLPPDSLGCNDQGHEGGHVSPPS